MSLFHQMHLAFVLSIIVGCAPSLRVNQVPFDHGSVDFNNGALHELHLPATDTNGVALAIHDLAKQRNLVLVKRTCPEPDKCTLIYKGADDARSKTMGSSRTIGDRSGRVSGSGSTHTHNLTFGSRFYFDIKSGPGGSDVSAVGVPTLNGDPSCPAVLESRGECRPEPFNVMGDQTPAESFKGIWGVDISGKPEAEIIEGIFSELTMSQPEGAVQVGDEVGPSAPSSG